MSKLMTAQEAIGTFLHDGDCIAVGGFVTNRRPYALINEIVRQNIKELYVEGGPAGGDIDILIGCGQVAAIQLSYIANSGFTQVSRRFREAAEQGSLLYEDYSLDVQAIACHGAALGLSYVPVKNMLGSDIANKWHISQEERAYHPKLPLKKFVIQEDPFHPGSMLCCVPTPEIDVALIHAQLASPDGTVRIEGSQFQDVDIAISAKHTIVSCERVINDEEMHSSPQLNTIAGLCVDAVVESRFGAHPSQCFGCYDYDPALLSEYDMASRTQEDFEKYVNKYIRGTKDHDEYLRLIGERNLKRLLIDRKTGYVPHLRES